MGPLVKLLMVLGAVAVALAVWFSVGAQFVDLWNAAWWAVLVALAFPAGLLGWYWYDEGRYR